LILANLQATPTTPDAQLRGVLENLEGGWFDGAVQSDPLCATPRTASVTLRTTNVQQGAIRADWALFDKNQTGLIQFSYSTVWSLLRTRASAW